MIPAPSSRSAHTGQNDCGSPNVGQLAQYPNLV